jgi:hypothetical protein
MIQPGTYIATIASHGITETKAGNPQVAVVFTFADANGPQKITYYGHFTEKAAQYTIKNLITCGLKGNNPAGDLEIGKQIEIVIDSETDENGRERAKVKYINEPGAVRNILDQNLAKAKLASLEGAVMAARLGSKTKDSDEIPF